MISEAQKPSFTNMPGDIAGIENKKLKAAVEFSGEPAPEVHWFRDGKEIFSGKRQWIETTETTSKLTIGELREGDEGHIKVCCTQVELKLSTASRTSLRFLPNLRGSKKCLEIELSRLHCYK